MLAGRADYANRSPWAPLREPGAEGRHDDFGMAVLTQDIRAEEILVLDERLMRAFRALHRNGPWLGRSWKPMLEPAHFPASSFAWQAKDRETQNERAYPNALC